MNYKDVFIVGIGASAGGFEALQKFLSKIQMDDRISYVICQHLDAKKPTLLGELLSKFSGFNISAISEKEEIKGNHIYYCPPDKNLIVQDGKFLFYESTKNIHSPKPSIDIFFKSLAQEKKEKAIGIILSGTGSDGTEGIIEIEKNGGIALAEDEAAKYFSMPKSAIDSGKVLVALPPELLADGIINLIEDRKYFDKYFEIEDSLEKIFSILKDETFVDFSSYKNATVTRRIKKRIVEKKAEGVNEYIKILQSDADEVTKLKDELLIIVTSFFRDEDAFVELKKQLTSLIEKKLDNNIRIWVTACATGEEAYSIAMIISDILEEKNKVKKVTIFATDVSDKVINESRNRVFKADELHGVRKSHIDKYFEKTQKSYKVNKKIRDMIVFSKHDIIKDPPFLNLDMISCRNLLIYFNNELQKRILSIFYYSLRYESLLFLGKSETIGTLTSLFSVISNKSKIYKKLNDLAKVDLETLTYGKRNSTFAKDRYINNQATNLIDIDISINKSISNRFIQNGIVVDGTSYNILFYKGDCKEFLHHPQGVHTNELFRLVVDFLRLDVRATISEAKKTGSYVSSKKIRILPISEPKEYVIINVYPLEKNKLGEDTYFVSFDKITDTKSSVSEDKYDPIDFNDTDMNVLEDELLTLKERLQITIEELETSNEELQSTNEELQSTNEELQSTNEELETSNEELQSTNEELQAVNDELNTSNIELDFANNAFNNVLANLGAHVVILDDKLNIVKYTAGIADFFDLSTNDEESFSNVLLNSNIELPNLLENIKKCLNYDFETGYDVTYKKRNYYFSIKRINLPMSEDKSNKAIVLSFVDKTEFIEQDKIIFQQAKLVSMGEMIGNISHQWRQPLSVITTVASGIKLEAEYKTLALTSIDENMNVILDQAKYLSKTIDNFRDFIKESKDFGKTNIKRVVNETINLVEASLRNNFITLVINIDDNLEIDGSTNELIEAMINIVNNSKDALKEKIKNEDDKFIFINTKKLSPNSIELKITDTAGGIDEKIINRIQEPYFTTKHESVGTGLGLSIANKIIQERHHGKINIYNDEFEYNSKHYKGLTTSITFEINK